MWVGKINIIMQICFEKMEINKGMWYHVVGRLRYLQMIEYCRT